MGDLNDFAARLKRISDSIEPNVDKLLKDVVREVHRELLESTPVDTGRARASWQTTTGEPATGVLYPQPQRPPSPEAGAARSVAEMQSVVEGAKPLSTYYIQNNTPYIGRLDAGSSRQAPANFVARAAQRGRALVKGAAGRIFVEVKKGSP
jgi:hypothetical protein